MRTLLPLMIALASCGHDPNTPSPDPAPELLVAAAQSLQGVVEPAADALRERHPAAKVTWTFDASGTLARQIAAGAPVDVFLSASQREMDRLHERGLILPDTRRVFARNRLVLIAAQEVSTATLHGWNDLSRNAVRRIAIGDPSVVPVGQYSDEVLQRLGLRAAIESKIVYGANVRQVLDYVARGEVEAGVVFASDVSAARRPVRVVAEAPPGSHTPIEYPMAVVAASRRPELSREFLDLLASPPLQAALRKAGFLAEFGAKP